MYCPKCGEQVRDGANFCAKCGASLTGRQRLAEEPSLGIEADSQSSQSGPGRLNLSSSAKQSIEMLRRNSHGLVHRAGHAAIALFLVACIVGLVSSYRSSITQLVAKLAMQEEGIATSYSLAYALLMLLPGALCLLSVEACAEQAIWPRVRPARLRWRLLQTVLILVVLFCYVQADQIYDISVALGATRGKPAIALADALSSTQPSTLLMCALAAFTSWLMLRKRPDTEGGQS